MSELAYIVTVDVDSMGVVMHSDITMGYLTATLLPLRVCVTVVPECDNLTVGGLVCGYDVDVFCQNKYGIIYNEVDEMEDALADGKRVKLARNSKYSDLFHALPCPYGALGMLVGFTRTPSASSFI